MEQNLHNHIKKDKAKWVVVFIAIILILVTSTASLVMCIGQIKPADNVVAIGDNDTFMTGEKVYAMPSTLSFSSEAMTAAAGHSVSVTLQATVLPTEAENKKVDWAVSWAVASQHGTEPVTNYVTVTPKADGSNTATVTCIKAFGDDTISVTVTTREGGYSATCTVRYIGVPTSMSISTTGATNKTISGWTKSMVEVKCGKVYNFAINLNNEFGLVGSAYTPEYEFSLVAHGSINTTQTVTDRNGNVTSTNHPVFELKVADTRTTNGTMYTYFEKSGGLAVNCTFAIQDGKLVVTPNDVASSYSAITGSPAGTSRWAFASYVDNKMPYATVTVTEKKSGLSKTYDIIVSSDVQSVSLSQTAIDI